MRQRRRDERENGTRPRASAPGSAPAVSNQALGRLLQRARPPADASAAQQARDEARQGLDADRKRLLTVLASGRKHSDVMTRNSVEWLEQGALGVKLYAVRKTGDSADRAPQGQAAFFPAASAGVVAGHVHDANLPDYAWNDLDDQTGVSFNTATAGGWNTDGGKQIAIEVGTSADAELYKAIKHE